MKCLIFAVYFFSLGVSAAAAQSLVSEAKCKYSITEEGRPPYELNGVIRSSTGLDYLTLEPNINSGKKFSARVLLTGNYNPVSLHLRGDTSRKVASGDLAVQKTVEIEHVDENVKYHLICRVVE